MGGVGTGGGIGSDAVGGIRGNSGGGISCNGGSSYGCRGGIVSHCRGSIGSYSGGGYCSGGGVCSYGGGGVGGNSRGGNLNVTDFSVGFQVGHSLGGGGYRNLRDGGSGGLKIKRSPKVLGVVPYLGGVASDNGAGSVVDVLGDGGSDWSLDYSGGSSIGSYSWGSFIIYLMEESVTAIGDGGGVNSSHGGGGISYGGGMYGSDGGGSNNGCPVGDLVGVSVRGGDGGGMDGSHGGGGVHYGGGGISGHGGSAEVSSRDGRDGEGEDHLKRIPSLAYKHNSTMNDTMNTIGDRVSCYDHGGGVGYWSHWSSNYSWSSDHMCAMDDCRANYRSSNESCRGDSDGESEDHLQ
ncbi:hypothetical protein C0J52_20524 [Blattella germanica]|nr:hypothetical protein C0J52_20524 [Blattella germanica]